MNAFIEELQHRRLIQQCSDLETVGRYLDRTSISFYLGIDPTASSLHCGHLLPILLAKRMALAGHQALLLIGSGTAKIGDPSGKNEMRQILSVEDISANATAIQKQLRHLFSDCPTPPIFLDNAAWLDSLAYIPFLRDIGRHFSVNRMLGFESYKQRLERGLSFIEFNYQLLQSYDYLQLFQEYGCLLQIGGDDQWGNMVSGIDLIRRYSFIQDEISSPDAADEISLPQVLTVPLVMNSSGQKMGKTEQGAVFLDSNLTSPFDFFQYWRNCNDPDVERFLLLFTFLSVAEIRELCSKAGASLNQAKEILAYELCLYIHGQEEADRVLAAARVVSGAEIESSHLPGDNLPEHLKELLDNEGVPVLDLYIEAGLCSSRNEARRLIQNGGASINGQKIEATEQKIFIADLEKDQLLLRAGKKRLFCFYLNQ